MNYGKKILTMCAGILGALMVGGELTALYDTLYPGPSGNTFVVILLFILFLAIAFFYLTPYSFAKKRNTLNQEIIL